MTFIVETHSEEALAVLEYLATYKLATIRPKRNGTYTPSAPPQAIIHKLEIWANDPQLSDEQRKARLSLIPRLLDIQISNSVAPKPTWAGTISPERAA